MAMDKQSMLEKISKNLTLATWDEISQNPKDYAVQEGPSFSEVTQFLQAQGGDPAELGYQDKMAGLILEKLRKNKSQNE